MPCGNPPVPGPTSGEPHCGPSVNQPSRVPEAISRTLSQNSSGTSGGLNTSPVMPSGLGGSVPDIPIPSETSRSQVGSPVHTHDEDIDQITSETLLEEVVPQKGPTTGGIHINLWGQNFPAVPLFVCFGDNWARAVSLVTLDIIIHSELIPKYLTESARCPYSTVLPPSVSPSRCRERDTLSNTLQECT